MDRDTKYENLKNGYSFCSNEWSLDKEIKSELGLLLIISSLTAERGYAFASNSYFAELFDITEVAVSNKIKKLEKLGYLDIEYKRRGAEITSRNLRLKKSLIHDTRKNESTIKEKFKDNTIIDNTIIKEREDTPLTRTLNYFNENRLEKFLEKFPSITIETMLDLLEAEISINYTEPRTFDQYKDKILAKFRDTYLTVETTKWVDWCNQKFKRRWKVVESLKSSVGARLDEKYTVDEMIEAMEIAMTSNHHIESNFTYLHPEFMTRAKMLEKWLNSPKGSQPKIDRNQADFYSLIPTEDRDVIAVIGKLRQAFGLLNKNIPEEMSDIINLIKGITDQKKIFRRMSRTETDENGNSVMEFETGKEKLFTKITFATSDSLIDTNLYGGVITIKWLNDIFGITAERTIQMNGQNS